MKLIDNFEKDIRKPVRFLDEDDLNKIFNNDNLMKKYFIDPEKCDEILDEIIKRCNSSKTIETLIILKNKLIMLRCQSKINDIFSDYRAGSIDRQRLLEEMKKMRETADSIEMLSAILCSLISLSDVSLLEDKADIQNGIEGIHRIIKSLGDIKESYSLRCDLIDLIYQVREWYFTRNQVDLLKDIEWVTEETNKLNEFEDSMLEEIPDINISPESLGYIDITKLKGKE